MATRYGLDGPGIESRVWGAKFSAGVKRSERGADHPLPYSAEIKERV